VLGFATGFAIAKILVKVLTGVFDPAPEALSIPWSYLVVLIVAGAVSTAVAVVVARTITQRRAIEALRTI
jgi:putative ABC transport system permease protein